MISSVIYYSTDARKNEIYLLKTQADDEILPYLYFYITQPKTLQTGCKLSILPACYTLLTRLIPPVLCFALTISLIYIS